MNKVRKFFVRSWELVKMAMTHLVTAYLIFVVVSLVGLGIYRYNTEWDLYRAQESSYARCLDTRQTRQAVRDVVAFTTAGTGSPEALAEAIAQFPPELRENILNLLGVIGTESRIQNEEFKKNADNQLVLPDCEPLMPGKEPSWLF